MALPSPSAGAGAGPGCGSREWLLLPPPSGSWSEGPAISAAMFSAGLVGNLAALGLLVAAGRRRRGRGEPRAPFHGLALALVLTDLSGTCLLSPAVLWAYGRGRTLVGLDGGRGRLCGAFAFAMSFFGLATPGCLGAMALERSLALGAPYLHRRLRRRLRPAALAALYALPAALAALPLLGLGRYVQYCPGTWCFLQMHPRRPAEGGAAPGAFSLLYASLLLALVLAVLLGNLSAIRSLLRMQRRSRARRRRPRERDRPQQDPGPREGGGCCWRGGSADDAPPPAPSPPPPPEEEEPRAAPGPPPRRPLAMAEEIDHLILLSAMTLIFALCTLPFTIRAFMNYFAPGGDNRHDLLAMRFLSINSIIDPWVFVILRPPVLRFIRSVLCCRTPFKLRIKNKQGTCVSKPKPMPEVYICRQ